MKRFTILSLMGLVVVLAVGIAALREANDDWAGGLLLATPLILCLALLGSLRGKEIHRSRRLGFALFGWAYFALAFLGLSEGNLARLPTSKLLQYIHQQVVGAMQVKVMFTTGTIVSSVNVPTTLNFTSSSTVAGGAPSQFAFVQGATGPAPPNRWKVVLPGAANYDAFQSVGHCLFALIAGLLGAVAALWFERGRREADQDRPVYPPTDGSEGRSPVL
jgi:hypothetical protein